MNRLQAQRSARLSACLAACFAALALLGGCASTTPDWDRHFGDSTRLTLQRQVLCPDAARRAAPAAGMDGAAAVAAYESYQKSFRERPPQQPASQ